MSKYYEVSGRLVAEFSEIVEATNSVAAQDEALKFLKVLGHNVLDFKVDNIEDLNNVDFEDL